MPSSSSDRFELKIPYCLDYLDAVRKFVGNLAREVGFNEAAVDKIVMAADEAVSNSIAHNSANEDLLYVVIEISPGNFQITIEDAGDDFVERFNRDLVLDDHLKEMRENGLGIHIMKTFMDEVDYRRTDKNTNRLTMVKYLP